MSTLHCGSNNSCLDSCSNASRPASLAVRSTDYDSQPGNVFHSCVSRRLRRLRLSTSLCSQNRQKLLGGEGRRPYWTCTCRLPLRRRTHRCESHRRILSGDESPRCFNKAATCEFLSVSLQRHKRERRSGENSAKVSQLVSGRRHAAASQ